MRALTLTAYKRLELRAQGWEYASEMIIRAVKLGLRSTEVPISFYKDRNGRVSNVKRGGWTTSWKAGWRSLQVMFTNGPDFFLVKPGVAAFTVGLFVSAMLSLGPVGIGSIELTLHTLAISMALTIVGAFGISMGLLGRAVTDPSGELAHRYAKRLPFDRTTAVAAGLTGLGAAAVLAFAIRYATNDYRVTGKLEGAGHLAMFGLLLVVLGFVLFTTMLVLHAVHRDRETTSHG
jgi:hypothetical protein